MTLDSLSDACYSFAIENGAEQLLVGRGPGAAATYNGDVEDSSDDRITGSALNSVCASQFGNGGGGDVSYVAPCDADTIPEGNENHTVILWVDALCSSTANPLLLDKSGSANWASASPNNNSSICEEIQPYANPCGAAGCSLQIACVENADTPVTFNFTIMGQADQGFFDIAVNFRNIFCSAKYDCGNSLSPLNLLHDASGARAKTHVLGLACTGSPGEDVRTVLNFNDVTVECTGNTPSTSTVGLYAWNTEGNLCSAGAADGSTAPSDCMGGTYLQEDGPLFQAAVYGGLENLEGMNKVYLNAAFGIEMPFPSATVCSLSFTATAVNDNDPGAFYDDGSIYPYIRYEVPDLEACVGNHPVNESDEVTTAYTSPTSGIWFSYGYDGRSCEARLPFSELENAQIEAADLDVTIDVIVQDIAALDGDPITCVALGESGIEKRLAIARGRLDGLEARLGEMQGCPGFYDEYATQLDALGILSQLLRSTLIQAEKTYAAVECESDGGGSGEPPTALTVFVTRTEYTGNLGGHPGADAKCQMAADDAELDGTYRAWLSTWAWASANDWLVGGLMTSGGEAALSAGWKLVDGAPVAASIWDLTDGELLNAIDLDENGNGFDSEDNRGVWTGTNVNGTVESMESDQYVPLDCTGTGDNGDGWRRTDAVGLMGNLESSTDSWTDSGVESSCAEFARLYCFQVGP